MNAIEMQRSFERIIQQTDPSLILENKPSSDTIFQYLYQYTLMFVRNIYLQIDKVDNETRANSKLLDSIKGLATETQLNVRNVNSIYQNIKSADLPQDFFLYIRSNSQLRSSYLNQNEQSITTNRLMKEENVDAVYTTFYNKPIIRQPYVVFKNNNGTDTIEIIHDIYSDIDSIQLFYYRKPKPFGTSNIEGNVTLSACELPENVHMEIVEGAAKLFLSDRFATKTSNNNKQQQ